MDEDTALACWHQIELDDRRAREDEALERSRKATPELRRVIEELWRPSQMDMTKFAGSESKYLKAADLQGKNLKVTISNVALLEFEDDDGKKSVKPALSLRGKEKQIVCNATTVQELIQAYGADSEGWVGKEIRLSTKHYPKFGRDGIVITPLSIEADPSDDIPF